MLNFRPGDRALCLTAGGVGRIVTIQAVSAKYIRAGDTQYYRKNGAIVNHGVELVEERLKEIDLDENQRLKENELRQTLVESIHEACAAHKLRMMTTERLTAIFKTIGENDGRI